MKKVLSVTKYVMEKRVRKQYCEKQKFVIGKKKIMKKNCNDKFWW